MKATLEIESLDSVRMPPNKVLVEYFNQNRTLKYGSLSLEVNVENYATSDSKSSGRGRNLERTGKVIKAPKKTLRRVYTTYKGQPHKQVWSWETNIEISEGENVWFSSSAFDRADKFTYDGRNFMIFDYHKLYMSDSKMLNGFMLCESVRQPSKPLDPYDKYYERIYQVYKRGNPVKYVGKLSESEEVKEGDYILVRFDIYPLLEEAGHKLFSNKDLYIFQTKEIVAILKY